MCRDGGCGHFNRTGQTQFVIAGDQKGLPGHKIPTYGVFVDEQGKLIKLETRGNTVKARMGRDHGAVFSQSDARAQLDQLVAANRATRNPTVMGEIERCGLPQSDPPGLDAHVA